jgi:hypothetical protein
MRPSFPALVVLAAMTALDRRRAGGAESTTTRYTQGGRPRERRADAVRALLNS